MDSQGQINTWGTPISGTPHIMIIVIVTTTMPATTIMMRLFVRLQATDLRQATPLSAHQHMGPESLPSGQHTKNLWKMAHS